MVRQALGLVLALALSLALGACGRQAAQEAGTDEATLITPVVARPVQVGAIRSVVRASGAVTAPADAEYLATVTEGATIVEMPRAVGDTVATGDLLVRLDIPAATQAVTRQQAEVARARADFENARIAAARTRDVVERGLVARRDLEIAEQELNEAEGAMARAQAALAAAEAAAGRALVRAPFPGTIVQRFHNPGDALPGIRSDPILRLVDTSRLEITATTTAEDGARVAEGATARVGLVTGGAPIGLVVASKGTTGSGSDVLVRLTFTTPHMLALETPVQVDIDAEERPNAVFVPAEALVREGESQVVFVVNGDQAQRRPVTTGLSDDARVEITSGVTAGDLVITSGHLGLPDGARVSIETVPQ
jgi:RND family efflux transporter MFP subunit